MEVEYGASLFFHKLWYSTCVFHVTERFDLDSTQFLVMYVKGGSTDYVVLVFPYKPTKMLSMVMNCSSFVHHVVQQTEYCCQTCWCPFLCSCPKPSDQSQSSRHQNNESKMHGTSIWMVSSLHHTS